MTLQVPTTRQSSNAAFVGREEKWRGGLKKQAALAAEGLRDQAFSTERPGYKTGTENQGQGRSISCCTRKARSSKTDAPGLFCFTVEKCT